MSWPTTRLRPVEPNDNEVGFVKGRGVLPTGARTSQQKIANSQEQFTALFGYGPSESLVHSRAKVGSETSAYQASDDSSPKAGKGHKSPTRQSVAANSSEDMQHALGYRTKRKGEHDLTPAQQRAFQFRSAINKSTINLVPDLNPGSILESAAGYALPPSSPPPSLSPAILDGLRPSNQPMVSDGTLLGTMTLQKDLKPFSSSTRLPYQATNGGPGVESSTGSNYFLMPPVDVSMADAYNYNVPADVRTGEDAVCLFSSSAAKSGLIIYCNLNPCCPGGEYNPYDLIVVDRARVDPRHHYVLTQSGVTQMLGGNAQELQPFHAWQRDRNLFTVLRKLVFFKHNEVFQAFTQWRDAVRVIKFRARQRFLTQQLLVLSPTFHRALLNVRRMTLAVSCDTNGTWRKGPEDRWIEMEPELVAPSIMPTQRSTQATAMSSHLPSTSSSQQSPLLPPRQASLPRLAQDSSSGSGPAAEAATLGAATSSRGQSHSGFSVAPPGSAPALLGCEASSAGSRISVSEADGPEVEPPTPLPPERLPESGLPYQLGYVGTLQDQFTMADFKRMREEQRNLVASALQDMVSYVRSQIQAVGQAVQANLVAAQAAVAKPTRQEARQQRFEAPGSQAWKTKSLALARLDAEQRQRNLRDAVHAAHLLLRFITLADCLMLGQLLELARLAVLLCVRQLEIPRKAGLYTVLGTIEDPAAAAATTTVRTPGLPTWGRAGTLATVSFAASAGRRRGSNGMPISTSISQWSHGGDGTSPRIRPSDDTDDDAPEGIPTPAPLFVISPGSEELSGAVANLPREILHVVVVSAAPLVTYPEVRNLLGEISSKGIPVPSAMLAARGTGEGGGSVAARAAGSFNAEVLRGAVDVRSMMTRLQLSILNDYNTAMHHPAMMPYRGHEVLWGIVSRFTTEAYRSSGMTPEQLHADLTATSTWLSEMTNARASVIVGLVTLEMSALQRAALPVIQKAHSGIMSLLGGLLVNQSLSLASRLADYTNSMVARPSQLPEFVQYVEVIWPHLDPMSTTRQSISADLEHMTRLHVIYLESGAAGANGRASTPTLYHPLYWAASQNLDDDDDELVDPGKPPSGRKVRATWENLQAAVARYLEEARAAADYFQAAAVLMVTHLKTSLIESGNALQILLMQLRTGVSTDASADAKEVSAHLDSLAEGLRTLAASAEQHSSWARLLTHPSTTSLVGSLESQLATARGVLTARCALWDALAGWRLFLDKLYEVPCTDDARARLTSELQEQVGRIRMHTNKITSLHTDDDLTSTRTVTPAEQKLGAHLSLLVKSWQDILPMAQQLVNPAVKPRHLRMLLGWLSAHQTAAAAATSRASGGGLFSPELGSPLRMMQNPYAALPTHVRQDDAEVAAAAGRTSLAHLVTACSESAATRALVARISQVALGEAQLVSWLRSIQERMQAIPLTYSQARTWNSFTPTNLPEVLASLVALVAELGGVQRSPFYCGVLREFERVEQLLGGVQRSLQDAAACLDMWIYLNQLLHNPVVADACPDAVASLELLGTSWRKLNMAAMEQPTLTAAAVALQDCRVLLAGFDAMRRSCAQMVLPMLREAYPRLWLVGDEVLTAALAVGNEVEALPSALLEGLYGGARALHIQLHHQIERTGVSSRSISSANSTLPPMGPFPPQDSAPQPPAVVAVVGYNGEVCTLRQPVATQAPGNAPLRLEALLPALEAELRSSLSAHTRDCLLACGYMSPDVWVASFPSQSVMLVDAVVWTQTVTATLERTAQGERAALRNLLDQSVLRLETMARQLRGAMVAAAAAPGGTHGQPVQGLGYTHMQGQQQGHSPGKYGHVSMGRQAEDLPLRAARAALTAVGAATAAAAAPTTRSDGGELTDDDELIEPPMMAPQSVQGNMGSARHSMNTPQPPTGPPRMPAFLVAPTAATAAAAAATATAAATAAVPAVDIDGDPVGAGPYLPLGSGDLIGPASTAIYLRPRRTSILLPPLTLTATDNSPGPVTLARQTVRGIERLLGAGICHRQAVEELIGAEVGGPDSFDWQRNVRHYWDGERGAIEVAFGTQRHEYGFEYDGTTQDAVGLVLPMTVPSLLAAVSALQTSPVVSLVRAEGACSPVNAVRGLCSLLGRLHMHMMLDATAAPAAMARTFATAIQLNAWLSIEGLELLDLAALSALSELLQGMLAAAANRQPQIQIAGESIRSPWATAAAAVGAGSTATTQVRKARTASGSGFAMSPPAGVGGAGATVAAAVQGNITGISAAAAASPPPPSALRGGREAANAASSGAPNAVRATPGIFLSLPMAAYLPVSHDAPVPFNDASGAAAAATSFLTEASHTRGPFPHELCEVARRAGRAVTLHSADLAVALEAGLRCAGLRDAAEAARAAACWFRLASVQLASPPQLTLDAVTVRSMLVYIHREWLQGTGHSSGPANAITMPAGGSNGGAAIVAATGSSSTPGQISAAAVAASNSWLARVGGSALDALDAAMRAVVLPSADPEDLGMLTRLLDQVIGFAQRTPPPPELAGAPQLSFPSGTSSGSSSPTLMPPHPSPPVFNVRDALQSVLATVREAMGVSVPHAANKHGPAGRATGNGDHAAAAGAPPSPLRRRGGGGGAAAPVAAATTAAPTAAGVPQALAGGISADAAIPPPEPAWKSHLAALAYANAPLLIASASSIYDALLSHRSVLIAGPPGCGKTTAWKALVGATHGLETLGASEDLLHVYSETLHSARLQLGASNGGRSKADPLGDVSADGRLPTDWLLRRLDGTLHWALRRRQEGVNVQSGSAAVVGSSPKWVVFDGPLGTAKADALAALLLSRSVVLSSGTTVAELTGGVNYIWETSDLAMASPALLSALPVVHVGGGGGAAGIWDVETALQAGVRSVVKQQGMSPLVTARFMRRLAALLAASLAGCESVMHRIRERERGNHGPPTGLTLVSGLTAVFGEVVRSLDVPSEATWAQQTADLELALARCAVFASYWSLAGQVLGPGQRAGVEAAIREAAASADLHMVLPLGGSLATWLVAPKRGVWVPWAATLHSLQADRPAIVPAMPLSLIPTAPLRGNDGANSSEAPNAEFHYYRDVRAGAGSLGLFVPSAATQALQYAAQLVIQAGGNPVLVGPLGSGRRTLLHHLLATVPMQQLQNTVSVVPACATASPTALQAAVMWHLAPGAGGSLRPTPGHRLVVVVEDLNAAVVGGHFDGRHAGELTAAAQAAGGGDAAAAAVAGPAAAVAAGCEVEIKSAALEWLRHVLDERAIRDPVSGLRLALRGTCFAVTSTPHGLTCGAEQVGNRLRRHLTQLHVDAAARCTADFASPGLDKPQPSSLTTIFSRPAVMLALAQHTVAHLAHCGVPEALVMPLAPAGAVLAATLESVIRNVTALTHAGVTPALWHFDTAAISGIVRRVCGAVAVANGAVRDLSASGKAQGSTHGSGMWGLREVLQRLAFEVGRSVMGHLSDSASREALAKLLLQTMGRHLGALTSGRLDVAVAAARNVLDTIPPPPPAAALAQQHLHAQSHATPATSPPSVRNDAASAATPPPQQLHLKAFDSDPLEVLAAWADYSSRAAADLRSLRVSLAGRIPPREIDLLLAALMGSLPVYDDPAELADEQGPLWPVDGGGALRSATSGGPLATATAPWAAAESFGPDPGAAGWIIRRPLSHPALLRLVRSLLASHIRDAFRDHGGSGRVRGGGGGEALVAVTGVFRSADDVQATNATSVQPAAATAAAAAAAALNAEETIPLPRCNMGPLSLALLEDAAGQWGYAEMVRPVAAALYSGYFSGGNVVLVGSNTAMLEHTAGLAALASGANVIRVSRPPVNRSNGSMWAAPAEDFSLRQLLLQQFLQVLQPMAAPTGIASGGYYSQATAAASGGFAVPGVPCIAPGEADAISLVPQSWTAHDSGGGGGGGAGDAVSKPAAGSSGSGAGPEAEPGGPGTSALNILLLTEGMLQDDATLELLQSLLVRPAGVGALCRDLHEGAGLPLLKGLEPVVVDSDLGSIIGTAGAAAASSTGTGSGQVSASQDGGVGGGGGGVEAAGGRSSARISVTKNTPNRMLGQAANHRRRNGTANGMGGGGNGGNGTGTGMTASDPERVDSNALSPNLTSSGQYPDGDDLGAQQQQQQQVQQQPHQQQQVSTIPPMKSEGDSSSYGAARVLELRQAEQARAELEVLCSYRVVSTLRFLLIASPATWARLRSRYPTLATALTTMTAADPTVEDQQSSCAEALGNLAAHVADNSIPQHGPLHITTTFAGVPEPDYLDRPVTASSQAGSRGSEGADGAGSRAASPRRFGRSQSRSPSPESRGIKRNITLSERMAAVIPRRPKTAAEEREAARQRAREDSELLRRVGEVAVAIHAQAQELYRQMGLLDPGASLPLSKVSDLVHMLSLVHSSHRKVLQARQATLHVCLAKLATSDAQLQSCIESMEKLNNFMTSSKEELKTMRSQVVHLEKFIAETSAELADQEAKAGATQALVDQVHAEVDAVVAAAKMRYQKAIEEVGGLSEMDLAEIRSYKDPHVLIRLVVMALCVLFDWPTDWRNAQRLLGEQNPKLLDRLRDFDVAAVSPVQAAKLGRLLQEPEFNVVSVEQVSVAAKSLAWWVLSVAALLRTTKECEMRLMRIQEGEERLENTKVYIRKLRGELKAGETELTRQQSDLRILEHQLSEAGARLRDNDLQRSNITRLSGLVQGLIPVWRENLASVEARLPALVGDATLAVAAVVYLGPLDGRERSAVLGLWRDLLEQRGVPVSRPPFNFTAFVADRFAQMTSMLPPEMLANTQPLWRDNLAHMAMASRPPLLLDPSREGANLVKAMFGKSSRVFYLLTEEGLLDKMASAVRGGRMVIVDMYGTPAEVPLLARLCKRYEAVMRRTYANLATEPHHLYLRMRTAGGSGSSSALPLQPAVYQYTTPVCFALRGEELRASLSRALLAALASERELAARQLATRLWQHRVRLAITHDDIAFTIAHTKGLIWTHPGLVDSTVTKANQAAAGEAEVPVMEAALAEVTAAVERWRPLVDGVMRVHGVLEDLARAHPGRCGTLPESVLLSMFRAALRRGVGETPGALGLVRELQGPTAPPEMTVGEARKRSAKALVSVLLSRAPSRAVSRAASRTVIRGVSSAPSRMDSGQLSSYYAETEDDFPGSARNTDDQDMVQTSSGDVGNGATVITRATRDGAVTVTRYDSIGASTVAGLPTGDSRSVSRVRPDSASSAWTSWTDGGATRTSTSGAEAHAAAAAAAAQLLQATAPPPPPSCRMEDLAAAVLSSVWALVGAVLGRTEGLVFRLLLAVSEQQAAGEVTVDDAQLALYVLGKGTPSAQAALRGTVEATLHGGAAMASKSGSHPSKPFSSLLIQQQQPQQPPRLPHQLAKDITGALGVAPADSTVANGGGGGGGVAATATTVGGATASRLDTASSFMDPSAQDVVKQMLTQAHEAQTSMGPCGATAAATAPCPPSSWPSEQVLADLKWLANCAAGADLGGLAAAVVAAPRVWYTLLTADAMPRGVRPDLRATLSQSAMAQLPDRWRELLLNKPIFQVILTAILAPEALAAAADSYSAAVLGPTAVAADLTPAERLLAVLMSSPPAAPIILATAPGEDPVAVVHQAQALCASQLFPLEPHRDSHWASSEVVVRHVQADDPGAAREARTALVRAARSGAWLLLLTAHASPATLTMLLEQINARDYMMRSTETTFRLLLAMPADAVPRLHPNVLGQCVRAALQPPSSLRAAASAAMQTIAHPNARRFAQVFGAKGGSDIDVANHVLAAAILFAGLNHAVAHAALPSTAAPLTGWDFLAAVRIVRQTLMDGRIADDVSSLDYPRLHELLAAEVLMPALPAARLGRFAGWALQRLLTPGVLTLSYPVYGLVDPDAEPGNEVAATMPLNVRLPSMLDYLASLYGIETALQPPHAAPHALQQRGESLAAALTLHRLAAAPGPVSPARVALLPAEHTAVAPLAVQVAAAERVITAAMAAARAGTLLWPTGHTEMQAQVQMLVLEAGRVGSGEVVGGMHASKPATPMTPLNQLRVMLSGVSARQRLQQLQQAAQRPLGDQTLENAGMGGGTVVATTGATDAAAIATNEVVATTPPGAIMTPNAIPPQQPNSALRMTCLQPRPGTASTVFALASAVPGSRSGSPGAVHQQLRSVMGVGAGGNGSSPAPVLSAPWRGAFAWDPHSAGAANGTTAAAGGSGSLRFAPAGPMDATMRLGSAATRAEGSTGSTTTAGGGSLSGATPPSAPALTSVLSSAAACPAPELALLDLWATAVLLPLIDSMRQVEVLLRAIRLGLEARLPHPEGSYLAALGSLGSGGNGAAPTPCGGGAVKSAGASAAAAAAAATSTGIARAPTLSTNLSAIFAELWLAEVRALHGAVCGALGGAEELAAAAAQPGLHDTPGVRHILRYLTAGFVPPGWQLPPMSYHPCGNGGGGSSGETHTIGNGAGGGRSSRGDGGALIGRPPGGRHPVHSVTLEQWEVDVKVHLKQLLDVTSCGVDLRPAVVDISCLARPAAFLVCLRRAFAYEQNTHPNNVTCRLSLQPPADASGNVVVGTAAGPLADPGSSASASRLTPRVADKPATAAAASAVGTSSYPIAAPRSMAVSGLLCRDLEVPFGAPGTGLIGLGLVLPGPAGSGTIAGGAGGSLASVVSVSCGGGSMDASLALPSVGLLLEAHSGTSLYSGSGANQAGSSVAGGPAGANGLATGSGSSSLALHESSSRSSSVTAAAAAAAQSIQQQQAATAAAGAAAAALLAALRPCPMLYAVPGYADPALRKALGARVALRPPGGRNSRAAGALMAGLPASSVPPPSVPVPLAATPQEALLCDEPYRVAWECRPNSLAADAPPERLPLLALRRVGRGEGLGADRGTVLRLGVSGNPLGVGGRAV